MANWISSKLKVAENLLQQIDQQAAESLGKGERKSSDGLDLPTSPKLSGGVSLRDQLKTKKDEGYSGKLGVRSPVNNNSERKLTNDVSNASSSTSSVKDSDWTELLSTPKQPIGKANRGNSGVSGVRRGGRRVGGNVKGGGRGRKGGDGDLESRNSDVRVGDGRSDRENSTEFKVGKEETVVAERELVTQSGNVERNDDGKGKTLARDDSESLRNENNAEVVSVVDEEVLDKREEVDANDDGFRKGSVMIKERNGDVAVGVSRVRESGSRLDRDHVSESDSASDSESGSTSDSEDERRREERRQRRQRILAAKAAAKALEAIKEQENVVARLEGEKRSLEKILEERAKQAAQEASELQLTMMETMEAAEVEKQKHNHTRMEVLTRLAKLESLNADLAKSLAAGQWNLEIEANNVAKLRQQVDLKEVSHEELKRKISNMYQTRTSLNSPIPSKGFVLEREMLEAEYSLRSEKVAQLQEKATKLESDIDMMLKEIGSSTEVEVELKHRLRQMTDHLIQKQAQVEALCSDKATLLFRIEALMRLLDENKSVISGGYVSGSLREDLEVGRWESTSSKLRPVLDEKIQSGKRHLGWLLRQLDAIFSAGVLFLARNQAAKLWSWVYLVCLHLWVLYILFSNSQSTEDSLSNSVFSLENISNSIGV